MLPAMFCMQVRLAPETCGSYVVFVVFILFFLEQSIRLKIDSRNENQERLLQQDKCVSIWVHSYLPFFLPSRWRSLIGLLN
jgi:hypothetical protein